MRAVIFISLIVVSSFGASAQSLQQQFELLKENSENYKVYKVIKQSELNNFWNTVNDSVNSVKNEIKASNQQIKGQQAEISQLNLKINSNQQEIEGLQHETSHINVVGIDFSKDGYIILNFTIILILIAGLAVLYYKFRHDNKVAKSKVLEFQRLDAEFEDYKKTSLEKQMKLRRELQTERNRIDEIRST